MTDQLLGLDGARSSVWRPAAGQYARRFLARVTPRAWVAAFCVFHFLLWGLTNSLFNDFPPVDNLEQMVWSQDLALTYYKHPPLPSWLLRALADVFGYSLSLTYFAGAACAAISIWLLYELACEFVSPRRAAVAAMLTAAIIYYNYLSSSYNHNTVQLPFAIACIALFYRAQRDGHWRHWLWLGVAAGLMMLTKYSALLLFASCGLFLLVQRRLHEPRVWAGIAIATAGCAVLLTPHLLGLAASDSESVQYARLMLFPHEAGWLERLNNMQEFVGTQIGRSLPALLLSAVVVVLARRRAKAAAPLNGDQEHFLWIVGFGPLVLTLLFAAVTGARLLTGWATTFFALFGLWLVTRRWFSLQISRHVLFSAFRASVVLQVCFACIVAALGGVVISPLHRKHPQPLLPASLAPATTAIWRTYNGDERPLVVTDVSTGGLLVSQFGKRAYVIDGNIDAFTRLRQQGLEGRSLLFLTSVPPFDDGPELRPQGVARGFGLGDKFGSFSVERIEGRALRAASLTYYWALVTPRFEAVPADL